MTRRYLSPLLPLIGLLGLVACGVEGSEVPGASAGATVSSTDEFGAFETYDVVDIADLLADPAAFEGRSAVLEGELLEVCSSSGCWFELGSAEQRLMVLLRDSSDAIYGIPTTSTGRAQASGELHVVDGEPQLIARGVKLDTP